MKALDADDRDRTDGSGSADLDELLGEYFKDLESHRAHARTRILNKHPQYRSELRSFFDDYDQVDAQAEPLRTRPPPEHTELMGRTLGGYEVRRVVGYGAMGVVYEAWQATLRRRVALKVLPQELVPRERFGDRFDREARLAAGLDHPNICPVYEFGTDKGYRFIAMQFVEGVTLTDRIEASTKADYSCCVTSSDETTVAPHDSTECLPPSDRGSMEIDALLRLFVKLCHALQFIHERNVVHRDIKPGNIMLRASGDPVIVDFGLAREDSLDASSLTETGAVVGTLSYMSPEQIQGKSAAIDHRTDIYSLGVTLFECLTLRKPFGGQTRHQVYQEVLSRDPPDCRRLNPHIPKGLKVVVEKALEKEPRRRYVSAKELANDLQSVIANAPVRARPAGTLLRARRWARRHPALATLQVCVLVSFMASLGFVYTLYQHQIEFQRAHVESLTIADSESFPRVLAGLQDRKLLAPLEPYLRTNLGEQIRDSKERLHLALALSLLDHGALDYVLKRVPSVEPREARSIADVAIGFPESFAERLVKIVNDPSQEPSARLRAYAIASRLTSETDSARNLPAWLGAEPWENVGRWLETFSDQVRARLEKELESRLANGDSSREQQFARSALLELKKDDVDYLVGSLLRETALAQRQEAVEALGRYGPQAVTALRSRFTGTFPAAATEDEKDRLALQQANLAAGLLRLAPNDAEDVWALFRHSPDPRLRSFLIPRLATTGVEPMSILARLRAESEPSARYALVLALGQYSPDTLSEHDQERITNELRSRFVNDPEPGVHAAALWSVGQLAGVESAEEMEQDVADRTDLGGRRWSYVANGHCMMEIVGRQDFEMGAPSDEPEWSELEVRRRATLPRRYLLSAREVSWGQFAPFHRMRRAEWKTRESEFAKGEDEEKKAGEKKAKEKKGRSEAKARKQFYTMFKYGLDATRSRNEDLPANTKWHVAMFYCLWLSEQEGIPEDEWCYEVRKVYGDDYGWALKEDYVSKTGYRLPTAAEWEYACRANAVTRLPYGNADTVLKEYVWTRENSALKLQPRARLKPNDFGLFDMLGSLAEYCESDLRQVELALRRTEPTLFAARKLEHRHYFQRPHFYVESRGGSFLVGAEYMKASLTESADLTAIVSYRGFRLARTVQP